MLAEDFFKHYPYAAIRKEFAESILRMDDADRETVFSMLAFYIEQITELSKKHSIEEIIKSFYNVEKGINDGPASCRKGCAFCCHIYVSITKPEAQIILDFCRDNKIKIDWRHIEQQKKLNEQTHPKSEYSKCVFLKDNICTVYEARPFVCRNHFVLNKPELCDAVKYPKGRTLLSISNEREILQAAVLSYLNKSSRGGIYQNSLPRVLLEEK